MSKNLSSSTALPSTKKLTEFSSELAAHPQFKEWQSMQIGPYTFPSRLRSNEEAVGIQECIQLNMKIIKEIEAVSNIDMNSQTLERQHLMIAA